eukprot:scaffold1273_cov401-Prasinococcus_capsulatus_cf.AAC.6
MKRHVSVRGALQDCVIVAAHGRPKEPLALMRYSLSSGRIARVQCRCTALASVPSPLTRCAGLASRSPSGWPSRAPTAFGRAPVLNQPTSNTRAQHTLPSGTRCRHARAPRRGDPGAGR